MKRFVVVVVWGSIGLLTVGLIACAVSLIGAGSVALGLVILLMFAAVGWELWLGWRQGADDRAYRAALAKHDECVARTMARPAPRWDRAERAARNARLVAAWDARFEGDDE